jgi:hypothetical protein
MKKFIKAVIVASVLVSASSAFATVSKGASGTGGVDCKAKANPFLTAQTNPPTIGATATGPVQVINGKTVQ